MLLTDERAKSLCNKQSFCPFGFLYIKIYTGLFTLVFTLEDFDCHIIDSGVVKNYDTSVGTRLNMNATILTGFIVASTEVVSDCLGSDVELVGYLAD